MAADFFSFNNDLVRGVLEDSPVILTNIEQRLEQYLANPTVQSISTATSGRRVEILSDTSAKVRFYSGLAAEDDNGVLSLQDVSGREVAIWVPPEMHATPTGTYRSAVYLYSRDNTNTSKIDVFTDDFNLFMASTGTALLGGDVDITGHLKVSKTARMIEAYYARVSNSAAQSVATLANAVVLYNTDDKDQQDWHSTSTNTGRITPDVAGWYRCTANGGFSGLGAGNVRTILYIRKNGTIFARSDITKGAANSTCYHSVVCDQYFNGTTDYLDSVVFNGDSASRDWSAQSMSMELIVADS